MGILIIIPPAFAASNSTGSNSTMSNSVPTNLPPPSYMIQNATIQNPNTGITVTTDRSSYNDGDKITISGTVSTYVQNTLVTEIIRNPAGNIIKVDQIAVDTDKTFSDSVIATGLLWQSAGTYTISAIYGSSGASATTSFQFSGSGGQSGPSTIPVDGTSYSISYTITNGKVLDIKADPVSKSLTVSIQTTGDGLLTITTPRALIDATNSDGTDTKFVVLNDGQQNAQATEIMTTNADRTLAIPFENGAQQMVIVGTELIGQPTAPISPPVQSMPFQQQIQLTSGGTIDVGFSTNPSSPTPGSQANLLINFINRSTQAVQQHIDYKVVVMEGNNQICGTSILHTAQGSISFPCQFQSTGTYQVTVYVDGILFQPIPEESTTFSVTVGGSSPITPNPNAGIIVSTGQSSYSQGNTIDISGKVTTQIPNMGLTVRIVNAQQNMVSIASFIPSSDGSFSTKVLAIGPLWTQAGTYTVIAQYGPNISTTTTFYFSGGNGQSIINVATNGSYSLSTSAGTFNIPYTFQGGTIQDIEPNPTYDELTITVQVSSPSASLELTIPRTLLDSKQGTNDIPFIAVVDGTLANMAEQTSATTTRTVSLQLTSDNKQIGIIGTSLLGSQNGQSPALPPPSHITSNNQIIISNGAANTGGTCSATSCFNPQVININPGSTVIWTNDDTVGHTATSGRSTDNQSGTIFDSSLIKAGGSYTSPAFTTAGTYNYFCMVHPWMTGEIIVGQGTQSGQPAISLSTDKPSYNLGDTVTLTGSITGGTPEQLVALQGRDSKGNLLLVHTVQTDQNGNFQFQFPFQFNVSILASARINGIVITQTITINAAQLPPPSYITSNVQVTISNGASVTNGACSATSCFDPQVANIKVGQAITWYNADTVGHTATSGRPTDNRTGTIWDSSLIKAGGSYTSPAFTTSGAYNYFCMVHPWMTGEIIVGQGSQPSPTPTPPPTIPTPTGITVSTDKSSYSIDDTITSTVVLAGASAGQNIAISITDPTNTSLVARTITTDSAGTAILEVKLPTYAKAGNYQISATASVNGQNFSTSTTFTVQQNPQAIQIASVQATDQQGNPVSSFTRGTNGYVKVLIYSPAINPSLTTVNLFDSNYTAIGIGSLQSSLGAGQSETTLSFPIPNDAATGTANIYVDMFSDWPDKGGKPLTPESSTTVEIK